MPAVKLPAEVVAHAAWRKSLLSLPSEYQRHNVVVQGANRAYNWHGVVHVHDENGMRRSSPFQEKRADIFRVMVVGDSLTYGDGVDEKWTYPSVLQRLLAPDYRVEFLNLGVDGYQSEDVLRTIRQFTPKLKPNLIIYGVCLNDFLPSGVEQYGADQYAFPLPIAMKKLLTERTRVGKFLDKSYDALLIRVGAHADFVDDILRDFGNYQKRFMRDVSNMNKFALANGIPPLVSMVLDQSPQFGGRGHKIAKIAEKYLKAARIDVIDTEPYYRQYDGEELHVSRWEGHPNEQAHAIFAEMFKHRLLERGYLAPYRR